ncbi:MAG TPA: 16S rRNA (guanine(966)-N(2))-methyltransferase RsmD [Alphaproteobacteria bacterium]|nr:16S rRNA (guanine(966)-N(2))-methyltransferase RsmD [Alphaproteobacteria bacterium]
MRIVSGKHRGRRLAAPHGDRVRPTGDRARQALFNILEHGRFAAGGGSPLIGARVVDLFCGTGALGLEALSRGAAFAILIDNDAEAIGAARANVRALGETSRVMLRQADATRPGPSPGQCRIAFLDPPYRGALAEPAITALAADGWLEPGGIVVVEIDGRETFTPPAGFALVDQRRYGRAKLIFLRFGS